MSEAQTKNSVSVNGTHAIMIETVDNSGPQSTIKLVRFRNNLTDMSMTNPCVGDIVMLPGYEHSWHEILGTGTKCLVDGSTQEIVFLKKFAKYSK
jgi:hypothetical protein